MQEGKADVEGVNEDINNREIKKKNTILRSKTSIGMPKARIKKQQSDMPFRKKVKFADNENRPIHTVVDFEPFKYEKEYTFEAITRAQPPKKSKGCSCLVF